MRTVERRSCSAISPNPGTAMLVGSMRAFADDDAGFLERATANEFDRKRFADGFGGKLRVNILQPRDSVSGESDKNIADDDARLVRRTLGFHVENDGGSLLAALQGLTKRFRQAHGLKADAEVAARDAAFLQQRVHDAVHRGRRNGNGAKPCEARSRNAHDAALRVNNRGACGGRLQADVEADIGSKSGAGPSASFRSNEADGTESGNWTAGARASNDEREAAGLDGRGVGDFFYWRRGFGASKDGQIARGIAAGKGSGDDACIGQGDLNLFVTAQG